MPLDFPAQIHTAENLEQHANATNGLVIVSINRHPSEDIDQFACNFLDFLERSSSEKKTITFLVTYTNINGTKQLFPPSWKIPTSNNQ